MINKRNRGKERNKKILIDDKWDIDEKANDTRTYETKEYSLEALNHIIKKYLLLKKNENRSFKTFG
ncbi:MAG TPA: hypothetical protein VLA48_00785 [Nitrososphaeraceae archaeon]|jgi:hypothetical protein|nr:hypothetical protein [Nitrososphaeraceae archaeon]